ncbi:MAG: hypothetical protein EBS84_04755 [Proteobacteria bacterium]|nr:hypothetical protein [Verrucomicrobiota bacterium]NBU08311.1 hypothetical protein [Pseudomonadota bacterium]NDF01032.1 hypothetical protein [Verrucomicrobiota bacterium]
MKTKALLVAGLMMAASAASSLAQTVYSVNAVGFVNVTFSPGFTLACNPLNGATNTVLALFPSVPNGTSIFKFDSVSGSYTGSTFLFGSWNNPSMTLVPGEGFFFKNPTGTPITNTFVGNVMQGTLTTPLSAGFTLVGSQVPQTGLVSTDLGVPIGNAESIFKFDSVSQSYTGGSFLFGSWSGGVEPTVGVGEGFFVKKNASGSWTRTFSVNQ